MAGDLDHDHFLICLLGRVVYGVYGVSRIMRDELHLESVLVNGKEVRSRAILPQLK